MTKITLNNVASLIDATTAANTINANSATIQTAMDNTLSRDGTSPNTMLNNLDMNSKQINNLPAPATANSALRLADLTSFIGGGTITNIPTGGITGDALVKNSTSNFDVKWTSAPAFAGSVSATGSDGNFNAGGNRAVMDIAAGKARIGSVPGGAAPIGLQILSNAGAAIDISPSGQTIIYGADAAGVTHSLTSSTGSTTVNVGTAGIASGTLTIAGGGSGAVTLTPQSAASGTLNLPNGGDTLVGKATTDTLTNKTLASPVMSTAAPTTAGSVGYNGTTLTFGDGSTNHTLVDTSLAQTLTNKTISGASNTLSNVNLASQVTGNLPVTNLNSGTGATTATWWRGDGTWVAPPSGTMVFLETLTANNTATSLQSTVAWTSTYSQYRVVFYNLVFATSTSAILFQIHSGGAYQSTSYLNQLLFSSGNTPGGTNSTSGVLLNNSASALTTTAGLNGELFVFNPSQTVNPKSVVGNLQFTNSAAALVTGTTAGYWNGGNGAVDGMQITTSAGNIVSGTVKIYGIV